MACGPGSDLSVYVISFPSRDPDTRKSSHSHIPTRPLRLPRNSTYIKISCLQHIEINFAGFPFIKDKTGPHLVAKIPCWGFYPPDTPNLSQTSTSGNPAVQSVPFSEQLKDLVEKAWNEVSDSVDTKVQLDRCITMKISAEDICIVCSDYMLAHTANETSLLQPSIHSI